MKPVVDTTLEDLVLARLSVAGKRAPGRADVQKVLYPFVALRLTQAEWRHRFSAVLDFLREQGFVDKRTLALTDRGWERIQRALRLNARPTSKDWRAFRHKYLPNLISPSGGRSASWDPALALIAEQLRASQAPKTSASLVNTWLARSFGMRSNKLTLDSLRAALLARELGVPVRAKLDEVMRLGAAKLAGSPSGDRDELVRALTARWLAGEASGTPSQGEADSSSKRPEKQDQPLALVQKVRSAVTSAGARRFGPDKVFIASVWETLKNDPDVSPLGEQGFKRALVEAHRAGTLVLSRADLIAAMDPRDVAASETQYLNATYHFIHV